MLNGSETEKNQKNEVRPILQLWHEITQTLNSEIPATTFKAWVVPHKLTEIKQLSDSAKENCIAVIVSPSAFHALKFEKAIGSRVQELLEEYCQKPVELSFQIKLKDNQVSSSTQNSLLEMQKIEIEEDKVRIEPRTNESSPSLPNPIINNPVDSFHKNIKKEIKGGTDSLFSENTIQAVEANRAAALARASGLRPDFTFDTFAVSSSNEMAHAAAIAVSNKPGVNYNPLFFYGGVGVGKTHLMHAIANNILKNNPSFKVIYCTGEEFTNEIIRAIQNKRTHGFKDKYRTAQVLLIDDIQFLAGKNAVQEEFFHTFNALVKHYSQIILTSDRPPQEINLLEDRLRSRFEAGLVVDIQQPSFELRTAILLIKTTALNISLPMDLAQMVAAQVDSARKIEGVIKRLQSEVELKHREINHELISEILSEEIREQKLNLRLNPNDVLQAVAKFYNLKAVTIRGQKRTKEVVLARHIAMFMFKTELNLSYVEVGKWFGARDHTSAMHAIKKINALLNTNEDLQREINEIKVSLVTGKS